MTGFDLPSAFRDDFFVGHITAEMDREDGTATPVTDKAAFRIRTRNESGKMSKGYVRSYDLFDEQSQKIRARCDLIGNAALKSQEIVTDDGKCWTLQPDRKLMPSRWSLMDVRPCRAGAVPALQ